MPKTKRKGTSTSKRVEDDPGKLKYCSVRQIAEDPVFGFTVPMIRDYIHKSDSNGLGPAIRRIGKKILIRRDLFVKWLEEGANPSVQRSKDKPKEKNNKKTKAVASFEEEIKRYMAGTLKLFREGAYRNEQVRLQVAHIEDQMTHFQEKCTRLLEESGRAKKPCACSTGLSHLTTQLYKLNEQVEHMAKIVRLLFENIPGLKVAGFNVRPDGTEYVSEK